MSNIDETKTLPKLKYHSRGYVCMCGKFATYNIENFSAHISSKHENLSGNVIQKVINKEDDN